MRRFSASRWWGIVQKEFLQLRRDRITFAMIVGIPIVQLLLFGYAINSEPRHLPTAVVVSERSEFTRSFVAAMQHSSYFDFVAELDSEQAARAALARGEVKFVVNFPPGFTRALLRGEHPAVLIEADATDPSAAGAALATVGQFASSVAAKDLTGPLAPLRGTAPPFEVHVHRHAAIAAGSGCAAGSAARRPCRRAGLARSATDARPRWRLCRRCPADRRASRRCRRPSRRSLR